MTKNTPHNPRPNDDALSAEDTPASVKAAKPSNQRFKGIAKAVFGGAFGIIGEITAVVLGLAFAWLCVVNMIIAQRVANVSFLEADASRWFAGAFDGKSADVGDMTLAWEAADNTIIFRAKDILVSTASGSVLNTLTSVETELSLRDVARGKVDPIRVKVDGGALSFLRDKEGNFIAGLGTPETVGQFGPVWRGEKNDGDNDLEIGRIKSLDINNAKIYIRDAGADYKAQLNGSNIAVAFVPDAIIFDMAAELSRSNVQDTEEGAPLRFKGRVSPDLQNIDASFEGKTLNPANVLPSFPALESIIRLDAPLDITVDTLASRNDGLKRLDLAVTAGKGSLNHNGVINAFDAAKIEAAYDTDARTLNVSELTFRSDLISANGRGVISNLADPAEGLFSNDTKFQFNFDTLNWNGASLGVEPIDITYVQLAGQSLRAENKVVFDNLSANFGSFQPRLKGSLTRGDDGRPVAASLTGRIEGTLTHEQLLSIWPETLISGARRWVDRAINTAVLSNLDIRFDADEAVLAGQPLKDPDLTLTFDLSGGEVKYISTMTPVMNVVGRGRLLGNQVEFQLDSGQVDDVILSQGKVTIPRIYPYGGDLIIEGEGVGPLTTLIGLLDQKPFEYVTPYGVSPRDFSGTGDIKLSVTRPLRDNITYDQVTYQVSGQLSDVTAPFAIGKNKLEKGEVSLLANRDGLSVKGPVNIGPWEADLVWQEVFDNGATPTRYRVNGRLNQSDLDSFGVGLREFIGGGDIQLSIDAQADGLAISQAKVSADLSETDMRIGPYWDKPKGVDAQMTGELSFTKGEQFSLQNVSVKSPGLDLEGALNIGTDYKLQDLNFRRAKIAGFIDAAAQIKPSADQERFDIYVTGDFLDVSPFVDGALTGGGSGAIDVPILLTGQIGRFVLSEAYVLRNANVLFAHNGSGVTEARLKGNTSKGEAIVNLSTNSEQGLRTLDVDIPDASDAAFAFFNVQSLQGGRLQVNADLPAVGTEGPLTGEASIENVKIVQAPIMTTMLSLASLQGLVDALGGAGLKFDRLDMPFSYSEGRLSVREGRAAGPGLGMTGNGEIDFTGRVLDMDGVLVPAYTANSMLRSIPLIGDIFVGKKGEGIFALNYVVNGPFDEAQVAVNPLSALTPGFLRGIFATQRDDLPEQLRDQIEAVRPTGEIKDAP